MTTAATEPAVHSEAEELVRQYHDARRREDQWRNAQLLLALVTPLLALISLVFLMLGGGGGGAALISGALTLITATAAALLAVEVWRWHRTATGIANRVRTDYAADATLLLRDPL